MNSFHFLSHTRLRSCQGIHANIRTTTGMKALELDNRALEEDDVDWGITFSFVSRGWLVNCFTKLGIMMHLDAKLGRGQADRVSVLLWEMFNCTIPVDLPLTGSTVFKKPTYVFRLVLFMWFLDSCGLSKQNPAVIDHSELMILHELGGLD